MNLLFRRCFSRTIVMSQSKFEYVRKFETKETLLPNTWIVVRVDGRKFHVFTKDHEFAKPNDLRALNLANASARVVLAAFPECILAYGQSDEYSFVFLKNSNLYSRRSAKIVTNIVSMFAANYVYLWPKFFPDAKLKFAPSFDGRCVCYPSDKNLRDYLSWRQADCHINNLYNTVFWALVQKKNLTNREAEELLKGTLSGDKNEILFSEFGINYNNEPPQYRKGTTLLKKKVPVESSNENGRAHGVPDRPSVKKERTEIFDLNVDIIGDDFWNENSHILIP